MSILVFLFALELGFVPQYNLLEVDSQSQFLYYTELTAGFDLYDIFFIKSTVRTYIQLSDAGYTFNLLQADYSFNIGIRPFPWLEVGWKENCYHPIIYDIDYKLQKSYLGSRQEIYIKISGKIDLIKN